LPFLFLCHFGASVRLFPQMPTIEWLSGGPLHAAVGSHVRLGSSPAGVVVRNLAGNATRKAAVLETFGLAEGGAVDEGGVVQDLMSRLHRRKSGWVCL